MLAYLIEHDKVFNIILDKICLLPKYPDVNFDLLNFKISNVHTYNKSFIYFNIPHIKNLHKIDGVNWYRLPVKTRNLIEMV